jgi:hypothetical protein
MITTSCKVCGKRFRRESESYFHICTARDNRTGLRPGDTVRLDVRRIETLKDGSDTVGNRTRVKVVKNKVAAPFRHTEFVILYRRGISREDDFINIGVAQGIVRKSGDTPTNSDLDSRRSPPSELLVSSDCGVDGLELTPFSARGSAEPPCWHA